MDTHDNALEGRFVNPIDLSLEHAPGTPNDAASFCVLPWTHVFVSPQGEIKPCCRFKRESDFPFHNSPQSAFHSVYWQQLRAAMLENKKIPGCTKCDQEDLLDVRSLRQKMNADPLIERSLHASQPLVRFLEVAFSNTCNLTCIMCDSRFSSAWAKSEKQLFGETLYPEKKFLFKPNDLLNFPHLQLLKITGGEPFLEHALHRTTLETVIDNLNSTEFTLDYSTNLSVLPKPEIIELWSKFKRVEVTLSLDSIFDEELRYIRYPSDGATIRTHVKFYLQLLHQLPNLYVVVRPTVHSLNLSTMLYTLQWWHNEKQNFGVSGRTNESVSFLAYPEFLHPCALLPKESEHLHRLLGSYGTHDNNSATLRKYKETLINYLSEKPHNPKLQIKLKEFLQNIDVLRNTNYRKQFVYLN